MKFKKWLSNKLLAKVKDEEGSFPTYIKALESGKFRHRMFYGIGERLRGFVTTDPIQNPGALFIGGMGSGKSVAMRTTLVTHLCANSQDTIYILMDALKGMTDYAILFGLKDNVAYSINDTAKITPVIDMIYKETMARKEEFSRDDIQAKNIHEYNDKMMQKDPNFKPLAHIIFAIEEFHAIPPAKEVKFHMNVDRPGSTAYKLFQLLRVGRSYGVQMMAATQRATSDDMPSTLKAGLSQTMAFRVNAPGDATAANLPEAAEIRKEQKGRCVTQDGPIQFPFLGDETINEMLDKYYKPLSGRMMMYTMDDFHKAFSGKGNSGMTKVSPLKELVDFANQFAYGDIVARFLEEFDYEVEMVEDEALGVNSIAKKNGEQYAVLAVEGRDQSTDKFVEKFKNGMNLLGCEKVLAITLDSNMPGSIKNLVSDFRGSLAVDKEDLIQVAMVLDNKENLKKNNRYDDLYSKLIFIKKEKDEDLEEEIEEKPLKTKTGGAKALMDLRAQLKKEMASMKDD